MRPLLAALLLWLGLWTAAIAPVAWADTAGAQSQPAQIEPTQIEPAQPAGPALATRAGMAFVRLQRDVNRAITSQLTSIRRGEGPLALWLGLGIAFLYGVAHALGPGHGKAVVASYFLSR